MDLNDALAEFDAAETTLSRLEGVWHRMTELMPDRVISTSGPEAIEYGDLCRAFRDLAENLPALDGWVIADSPLPYEEIWQDRFDAQDIGEPEAILSVENAIHAPGEAIREYRFRFNRGRRSLVRPRVRHLIGDIDAQLAALVKRVERDNQPVEQPDWSLMAQGVREIERLLGSSMSRKGRWGYLSRHIAFGQGCDVHDIAEHDWPSVKQDIESALYGELEPIPTNVKDLADLAATKPAGPVSTKLTWQALDGEGFERLIFNIISDAPGYENPKWLIHTNAPDRGRDLSVDRVVLDSLSGVTRYRVIIQCRHSLSKSVSPKDVADVLAAIKLWEPPPIDVLVMATSGRFSADAVAWIEQHNHKGEGPTIDPWPDSQLESLLAQRPALVTEFGLRPRV